MASFFTAGFLSGAVSAYFVGSLADRSVFFYDLVGGRGVDNFNSQGDIL